MRLESGSYALVSIKLVCVDNWAYVSSGFCKGVRWQSTAMEQENIYIASCYNGSPC